MLQLAAALFFLIALVAPLAVIVLTLHHHWLAIIGALTGRHYAPPLPGNRPARLRGKPVSCHAAQPPVRPARAAA